jgi:hypothetical protein
MWQKHNVHLANFDMATLRVSWFRWGRVWVAGERRLLACRSRQLAEIGKIDVNSSGVRKDVAGRAAGNYRLAACAPQRYAARGARALANQCAIVSSRSSSTFFALSMLMMHFLSFSH